MLPSAVDKAATEGGALRADDIVGTTFYIACNMMLAFTAFFFVQVGQVPKKWKTSVSIAGLVTGVAWYNYTYMKDQWVKTGNSPTQYRYTDWLITVPLQIVEFYFILKATTPVNPSLGTRLFLTSLFMVFAGWMGENNVVGKLPGFVMGMLAWLYIVYETFAGEAAGHASTLKSEASIKAFSYLRLIVSIGWIIYPVGYMIAYIIPGPTIRPNGEGPPYNILNIVYNFADLINKGAFGLAIWSAAAADKEDALLG